MGPEYTLLRLNPEADAGPLQDAAARRGVPLTVLDVQSPDAARLYQHAFVLSRPDQHVAWRGDAWPGPAILETVTGRGLAAGDR